MIELPKECYVGKFIPKKTFYERVNISNSVKDEFINIIEKITWQYKVSESTIQIPKTDEIEEIQVFEIELKEKQIPKGAINIIAKSIQYPILFNIKYGENQILAIKYDEVHYTEWNENIEINWQGINLKNVYENIVKAVLKEQDNQDNIEKIIETNSIINEFEKQISSLERQLNSETQFNKKVEINQRLQKLKKEMEAYKNG